MRKDIREPGRFRWLWMLAVGLGLVPRTWAQAPEAPARLLGREQAVHHALEHNPALRSARLQSGFAEAAIIIARTYPFNPIYTGYFTSAEGPPSAGINNNFNLEDYIVLELELRGQGRIRRAGADATRNRIENEIAQQEVAVSIGVIRAYNAVLYRQKKLEFLEEGIKVNEAQVEKLQEMKKTTELLLARADLQTARAQRGQARTLLAAARSELRRFLGTLDDSFLVTGEVAAPLPRTDQATLTELALNLRPDLQARRAAVLEAEAALNLQIANRYGNPSFGPFFAFDPTAITYIGGRISTPVPILNTRKGEIYRAETEVKRVKCEVQQVELQVSQDVFAALTRLDNAIKWATSYYSEVLPDLIKTKRMMEKMFADNDPAVDLAKYLAIRRAFLKATENYLDASFEVSQAETDLAQAVAVPSLALGSSGRAPSHAASSVLPRQK